MRYQNTTPNFLESAKAQPFKESVNMVDTSANQKYMEAETKKAIIEAVNLVNVKNHPADSAAIVGQVQKGEVVEIVGTEGKYNKIHYGGNKTGFVASRFCKEV